MEPEESPMFYQSVEELEEEKQRMQEQFRALEHWKTEMEEAERWICPLDRKGDQKVSLSFQVAEVQKPLISVKRIVENGNYVCFGPERADNYILNKKTGDKMELKPHGRGSFVMEVTFADGEQSLITVDSGAEENVCPMKWGQQFGLTDALTKMNFRSASGDPIPHYGQREVVVESPF